MARKQESPEGSSPQRAARTAALTPGIGARIRAAADRVGSRAAAAQAAGVSADMIYRYIREQSPPSFAAMVGLARAARFRLEWIATGDGEPETSASAAGQAEADLERLEEVVVKIRSRLDERSVVLAPEAEARIIRLVYEFHLRNREHMDDQSLDNVIELAAFR